METRHYCVLCGTKQKGKYMYRLAVPDIKKSYWLCFMCYKHKHSAIWVMQEPTQLWNPTTGLKLE